MLIKDGEYQYYITPTSYIAKDLEATSTLPYTFNITNEALAGALVLHAPPDVPVSKIGIYGTWHVLDLYTMEVSAYLSGSLEVMKPATPFLTIDLIDQGNGNYEVTIDKIGSIDTTGLQYIWYGVANHGVYCVEPISRLQVTYSTIPSSISYAGRTYVINELVQQYDKTWRLRDYSEGLEFRQQYNCVGFLDCVNMVTAPEIPDGVTNMDSCFSGCESLTIAPTIPIGVTSMDSCFKDCIALVNPPIIQYDEYADLYIDSHLINMSRSFYNCTSLVAPPSIPEYIEDISYCFYGCESLAYAPYILGNNVNNITSCFQGCTSLSGDIYIFIEATGVGDRINDCFAGTIKPITLSASKRTLSLYKSLAQTSTNNNIYINVHPETPITFKSTQMNYMTEDGLKTLSLQTNADLVQCEVPDIVNGGTITTNANDALEDLYYMTNNVSVNGLNAYYYAGATLRIGGVPTSTTDSVITPISVFRFGSMFGTSYYRLLPATRYRFTGGVRTSGLSTILIIRMHYQGTTVTTDALIRADGEVVFTINNASGTNVGYESVEFITPYNISYCDVFVGFINTDAVNVDTIINPLIVKESG